VEAEEDGETVHFIPVPLLLSAGSHDDLLCRIVHAGLEGGVRPVSVVLVQLVRDVSPALPEDLSESGIFWHPVGNPWFCVVQRLHVRLEGERQREVV